MGPFFQVMKLKKPNFMFDIIKRNQVKKIVRRLLAKKEENDSLNVENRQEDGLDLVETATGRYYLPSHAKNDVIANSIKSNQIFDINIVETAKLFITPGSIVLDVGANYGQMSIIFSKLVGLHGSIYSFEANSFVYEILQKNIVANDVKNIKPIYGAVYNESNKELNFPTPDLKRFGTYGSYGIDYLNKSENKKSVSTIKIDDIYFDKAVSFMKIDVQGGDLFVMEGAIETIKRFRMPIIFEFEYQFQDELNLNFQEYIDFVNKIDYKFTRVIDGYNYLIQPR